MHNASKPKAPEKKKRHFKYLTKFHENFEEK